MNPLQVSPEIRKRNLRRFGYKIQEHKRRNRRRFTPYSILGEYRTQGKLTREIEKFILSTPLEDILALKIETAARTLPRGVYGLPLFYAISGIAKEALLRAAVSLCPNVIELASFLGVPYTIGIQDLLNVYGFADYFVPEKESLTQEPVSGSMKSDGEGSTEGNAV